MFGILLSAFNAILGFVLRGVVIKFIVYSALFFVTTEFIHYLTSSGVLPNGSDVSGALLNIPSSVWYFLDLFNVSLGIPLIFSAYATRFIIRRIPIIG